MSWLSAMTPDSIPTATGTGTAVGAQTFIVKHCGISWYCGNYEPEFAISEQPAG